MLVCDKCEETSVTLEGYEPTGFYRMYDNNGAEVVVCELCREDIEDE
jgi:hypothetical protein